jgi:hypothetical protein
MSTEKCKGGWLRHTKQASSANVRIEDWIVIGCVECTVYTNRSMPAKYGGAGAVGSGRSPSTNGDPVPAASLLLCTMSICCAMTTEVMYPDIDWTIDRHRIDRG